MPRLPAAAVHLFEALERSAQPAALFDPSDVLQYANRAYAESFLAGLTVPVSFADILRHGFRHGLGVRIDCGDVEQFLAEVLPRRRKRAHRDVTTDLVDGRWMLFHETLLDDGWLLTMATDISQLKQTERRIARLHASAEQAARTDPLTGVPNRRHILERAQAAIAEQSGGGAPVCLVLIDLDHFKSINDTHGHAVGDEVLRSFCIRCRSLLRTCDTLGRMGGEEFLVVMQDATAAVAEAAMSRLSSALFGALPVPCTFSAGIAAPAPAESLDDALERADRALYAAKRAGRDRCIVDVAAGQA